MSKYFHIGVMSCSTPHPYDERDCNGWTIEISIYKLVLSWWISIG